MSAGLMILLGAGLCFAGAWSARAAVTIGGAAVGWLLATATGASTGTALAITASAALAALVFALIASKLLLLVVGVVVGGLLGARLFALLTTDDASGNWLLAVIFVPSFAVLCGILAQRFRQRFVVWGTAVAGAGLMLSGLGRLDASALDFLWRPDSTAQSSALVAAWVALALAGRAVQARWLDD